MKRKYKTPNMEMIELYESNVIVCSNEGLQMVEMTAKAPIMVSCSNKKGKIL